MPLKESAKSSQSEGDAWEGPWGSISPTPRSVTNLRLEKNGNQHEKHLYPYRSFSKIRWICNDLETIEILAGRDRLTLTGRGLENLFAAIDQEQLQRVVETPEIRTSELETVVYSIQIESVSTETSG